MNESASDARRAEPWHRTAGVTALRTLVVSGVIMVVGVAVVLLQTTLNPSEVESGWEDLQAIVGAMLMVGVGVGYGGLVFWWVDHLMARRGRGPTVLVHAAIALAAALVLVVPDGNGYGNVTEKIIGAAVATATVVVATLLAGGIRRSFAPTDTSAA